MFSFQAHQKHSPRKTILWAIKQTSKNVKALKSYKACSWTIAGLFEQGQN